MLALVGIVVGIGAGIPVCKKEYAVFFLGRERPDDVADGQLAAVVGGDGALLHLDRGSVTGLLGSQIVGRSTMCRRIGHPVSELDLTFYIGISAVGIEHGNLDRHGIGRLSLTAAPRFCRTGHQSYNQK